MNTKALLFVAALLAAPSLVATTPVVTSTVQQRVIRVTEANVNQEMEMNGGVLIVDGANAMVKVSGWADRVVVNGANVVVEIEVVNAIQVKGANAMVKYQHAKTRTGKPVVSNRGVNSIVTRG